MRLNPQQREAAHAPGSVAVTAGAGTGKTHLLVARYLHLLQRHSPLEIVAVTFTEKAADELRARVRAGVTAARPDDFGVLAELEAAQISTLHALCARVVREHPVEAGVLPTAEVLDAPQAAAWQERQLPAAMAALPAAPYRALPFSRMERALRSLLQDPALAAQALGQSSEGWRTLLEDTRLEELAALRREASWREAVAGLASLTPPDGDAIGAQCALARQGLALLDGPDPRQGLAILGDLSLRGGSAKKWGPDTLGTNTLKAARGWLEVLRDGARRPLLTTDLSEADVWLARVQPVLAGAFAAVDSALWAERQRQGVLTYDDLERRAAAALEHGAVRAHYHRRFRALLLDEAQDTSPAQHALLQALQGPEATLTLVGDVKQSIYSFRRAAPERFVAAAERFPQVVLQTSYRTVRPLLRRCNAVFAHLLGALHAPLDSDLPGVDGEAPLEWRRATAAGGEASGVAARVEALVAQGHRPGEVAVLARTWGDLGGVGKRLAARGIPVQDVGGGSLLETDEGRDALSLLSAVATNDALSLVALLRSPFGGVSDAQIWALTRAPREEWHDRLTGAGPDFAPVAALLAELRAARKLTPSALLALADRRSGYTAVSAGLWGGERRMADWHATLDLVRAHEAGGSDVLTVVRRLAELRRLGIEVPRPPLAAGDAVTLSTVHSAKGLEWRTVFLTALERAPYFAEEPLRMSARLGVSLAPEGELPDPFLHVLLRDRAGRLTREEARRLLYVGMTRARERLVLSEGGEAKKGAQIELLQAGLEAAGITPVPWDAPEVEPALPEPPLPRQPDAVWLEPLT